jgi:hypothetical protein
MWCKAETTPEAPACLTWSRETLSCGPNQRQVSCTPLCYPRGRADILFRLKARHPCFSSSHLSGWSQDYRHGSNRVFFVCRATLAGNQFRTASRLCKVDHHRQSSDRRQIDTIHLRFLRCFCPHCSGVFSAQRLTALPVANKYYDLSEGPYEEIRRCYCS